MKNSAKKVRFTIIASGISLILLLCHALLLIFTPSIWRIANYIIFILSVANIPLLLLSFREVKSLKIRNIYARIVLCAVLLVSLVYTIISFQVLAQGLQTYTGDCQTRLQSLRSYTQIISSDNKHYDTMNLEIISTLKDLSGTPIDSSQGIYACRYPVSINYLPGFNYIVDIETQQKDAEQLVNLPLTGGNQSFPAVDVNVVTTDNESVTLIDIKGTCISSMTPCSFNIMNSNNINIPQINYASVTINTKPNNSSTAKIYYFDSQNLTSDQEINTNNANRFVPQLTTSSKIPFLFNTEGHVYIISPAIDEPIKLITYQKDGKFAETPAVTIDKVAQFNQIISYGMLRDDLPQFYFDPDYNFNRKYGGIMWDFTKTQKYVLYIKQNSKVRVYTYLVENDGAFIKQPLGHVSTDYVLPVYFPNDSQKNWYGRVISYNPTTYLNQTGRDAFFTKYYSANYLLAVTDNQNMFLSSKPINQDMWSVYNNNLMFQKLSPPIKKGPLQPSICSACKDDECSENCIME